MAMSLKGRRRLQVGRRLFFWDYREEGGAPGEVSDVVWMGRGTVVRVVSADKRWRMTVDHDHVYVDPGGHRFPFRPPRESRMFTPGVVRALIERYLATVTANESDATATRRRSPPRAGRRPGRRGRRPGGRRGRPGSPA